MIKNHDVEHGSAGWSRWSLALLPVTILSIFAAVSAIANAQADAGRRVLGSMDPIIEFIRVDGGRFVQWLVEHAGVVGAIVVVASILVALAGTIPGRRFSSPLLAMCAGVSFVGSGQAAIVDEHFLVGTCLYVCGIASTVWLGRCCPMVRLPGFPRFDRSYDHKPSAATYGPTASTETSTADTPDSGPKAHDGLFRAPTTALRSFGALNRGCRLEWLLLVMLVILGMLLRFYALTELPEGFDCEMIDTMIEARTLHGIKMFLSDSMLGSSVGFAHIPTQFVSHQVFGTSYFSVRLASVFWGSLTIPLFYWFLRRISGVVPALLGTLLFVAAPEQLFWSRSEDGHFAPMTLYAVVSGHLALWLSSRATWPSALFSALWMAAAPIFYFPSLALVGLPALGWLHGVILGRRGWRSARFVVPLLGVGLVLVLLGKSMVVWTIGDSGWKFYSPLVVHGTAAWKGHSADDAVSVVDVARHHVEAVAKNLPQVARGLTFSHAGATHWCQRETYATRQQPPPSINIAITAIVALGIGFLLGQPRDSRTAILLLWIALGLVPGLLSDAASPRRIGTIFPALLAVATIQIAVFPRVTRSVAGPRLTRVVTALCLSLAAVIAWTNLVSHFRLPIRPVVFAEFSEFIRPEMAASDTVFHTFEGYFGKVVFLSYLDQIVAEHRPCIDQIEKLESAGPAVLPECRFDGFEDFYTYLFPEETLAGMRRAHVQKNVSVIIHERFGPSPVLDALETLYPDAVADARILQTREFGTVHAIRIPAGASPRVAAPGFIDAEGEVSGLAEGLDAAHR